MSVFFDVFRKIGSFGDSLAGDVLPLVLRAAAFYTLFWYMADMMGGTIIMYILGVCFLLGFATRILAVVVFVLAVLSLFGVDVMGMMMMQDMMMKSMAMMMQDMMMGAMLSNCVLLLAVSFAIFAVGPGRFSVDAVIDSQV